MRAISVKNFFRVTNFSSLSLIVFGFHSFTSIYAVPIDSLISAKENQNFSLSSQLSDENSEVLADGISYRLDAWSQYDNPEEGSEREGDIHEFPETRKTITSNQSRLWPKGEVPYWVHPSIRNESEKFKILQEAMKDIMDKTCVMFKEIFPDEKGQFPSSLWLNITGNRKGCFSDLGCSKFQPSHLNLEVTRCLETKGHALHEILHSLGVFHEHMRPDRDDHIKILWNNIRKEDAFNFSLLPNKTVNTYGLPYDYDSIMHYSMNSFAKNRSEATIVPLQRATAIGQRDHLSDYDIKKILITYKCNNGDFSVTKNQIENNTNHINCTEHEKLKKFKSFIEETNMVNNNYDDTFDKDLDSRRSSFF